MRFLCSIPLLSSLLAACVVPLPLATGYVEGEYILLAPIEIAQISDVRVKREDLIVSGQELVGLEHRDAVIAAAQAGVSQAQATLENALWRLSKRTMVANSNGTVIDIIRSVDEIAGPQAPVLLGVQNGVIKLRLYVAESYLSTIHLGTDLAVECDGCADGITATTSYISAGPEFTPPVIYSLENRQKRVYRLEA